MFLYQGPVTALRKQSPQTRVPSQAIWATQSGKWVLEDAGWALWLPAFGWGLLTVTARWANLSIRHPIYHCKALLPCLIYSRLGCLWWKADNSVHSPFHLFPQMEGKHPLGTLDYYFLCHIKNECSIGFVGKSDDVSESAISPWKSILFSVWFLMGISEARLMLLRKINEWEKNILFCVVDLYPRCLSCAHTHTEIDVRQENNSPPSTWRNGQICIDSTYQN